MTQTPASALGSTRDKPDAAYCEKIFQSFRKRNVRYFFYVGGNDSADTARIVGEMARTEGYDLTVFHIPKTIDNDLRVHDHTPGFGSAGGSEDADSDVVSEGVSDASASGSSPPSRSTWDGASGASRWSWRPLT